MLSVIHACHVSFIFDSYLVSFHFDSFTAFIVEWLDTVGRIDPLEAAQWADEEDHEEEEDGGGDHGIAQLSRKTCQIIHEWSKAAFLWWALFN